MNKKARLLPWTSCAVLGLALYTTSCGLVQYPGQPGIVTNGYSKIDFEYLDESGLWVYEASYDNRVGGAGVTALVTKLYPNALTYTSNGRSGSHGSFYKHKTPMAGGSVQLIYLAETGEIMMPPDSLVEVFVEQDLSIDEIDDQNIAESDLFENPSEPPPPPPPPPPPSSPPSNNFEDSSGDL